MCYTRDHLLTNPDYVRQYHIIIVDLIQLYTTNQHVIILYLVQI